MPSYVSHAIMGDEVYKNAKESGNIFHVPIFSCNLSVYNRYSKGDWQRKRPSIYCCDVFEHCRFGCAGRVIGGTCEGVKKWRDWEIFVLLYQVVPLRVMFPNTGMVMSNG